jgi:hypothetical protein
MLSFKGENGVFMSALLLPQQKEKSGILYFVRA